MHGRVTLCLIAAALGIVVASPAVLAAGVRARRSRWKRLHRDRLCPARHAVHGVRG